ncbi:MAG TPA: GNAT family N-acetyltransferase [Gaiellaceae bacterium]
MVAESILELFDRQMRRDVAPDGIFTSDGWSAVLWPPADGDVEALVARLRAIDGYAEWKYYSHDLPADLPERLRAAGLEPDEEEVVLVAESASLALAVDVPDGVEVRVASTDEDIEAFVSLTDRVFGDRYGGSGFFGDRDRRIAIVCFADGEAVSGGRLDLEPGVDFAGMFGGATLPEWRGRGLYRATVAKRAEIARERGYRYVYVDALPTSRPILERVGFVQITSTWPYTFGKLES